ncbi:MAG: hypothetical protein ACKV2T_43805 [Kofleriaceae bacterium]
MRFFASLAALLVFGCSKPDLQLEDHRTAAAYIEKELAPETVNPRIAYFTRSPDEETKALAFQILRAEATCNGDVVAVGYNPYSDQLHIGFGTARAVTQHPLNLEIDGREVWKNPVKVDRREFVLDFDSAHEETKVASVTLDKITIAHREHFPPDRLVKVSATGKSAITTRVGRDQFKYTTHQFGVWRLQLHAFSPEMAKQLEEHRNAVYAAHAKLQVTKRFRDRIDRIRSINEAAIQRAVKRFDEIAVPAQAAADKLASVPFAGLSTSLSIEPASPCVATGSTPTPPKSKQPEPRPSKPAGSEAM